MTVSCGSATVLKCHDIWGTAHSDKIKGRLGDVENTEDKT